MLQRHRASGEMRKAMQTKVRDMIKDEEPTKDIVNAVLEDMRKNKMQEHDVVVMVSVNVFVLLVLLLFSSLINDDNTQTCSEMH